MGTTHFRSSIAEQGDESLKIKFTNASFTNLTVTNLAGDANQHIATLTSNNFTATTGHIRILSVNTLTATTIKAPTSIKTLALTATTISVPTSITITASTGFIGAKVQVASIAASLTSGGITCLRVVAGNAATPYYIPLYVRA